MSYKIKRYCINAWSFLFLFPNGMLFFVVLQEGWTQISAFLQQELNPVALLIVFLGLETHWLRACVNCSGHISRQIRWRTELRQEVWTRVLTCKSICLCNLAWWSRRVSVSRIFPSLFPISVCLLVLSPFGLAAFFLRLILISSTECQFFLGNLLSEQLPHLLFHELLISLISPLSVSFPFHLFVNCTYLRIHFALPDFIIFSEAFHSPELFLWFVLRIVLGLINNIMIMIVMDDSLSQSCRILRRMGFQRLSQVMALHLWTLQ